jgi:sensor c-di-GMP phosphodiesterase-like protein
VHRAPRALATDLGHDPRAARTAAQRVMLGYCIIMTGSDREAMLDLVRKHNVQVFDQGWQFGKVLARR